MERILFTIYVLILGVSSSLLKQEHVRTKRWKGSDDMSNMFRGTAGVDYPDMQTIPTTSFRCDDQQYEGGLYADVETRCQVYHVCHEGRKDSFLCGKGTIFNQQILACDYWYSAECDTAPSFYYLNSQIGGGSISSGNPQTGSFQNNPQATNQGNGYGSNNPNIPQVPNGRPGNYNQHSRNDGTGGNNPHSRNDGTGGNNQHSRNDGTGGNNPHSRNGGTGGNNPNKRTGGNNPNEGTGGYNANVGTGGNNPNARNAGNNPNDRFRGNSNGSGSSHDSNQPGGNQESCCCLKNTYKAPWNFPNNLVNPNGKK